MKLIQLLNILNEPDFLVANELIIQCIYGFTDGSTRIYVDAHFVLALVAKENNNKCRVNNC